MVSPVSVAEVVAQSRICLRIQRRRSSSFDSTIGAVRAACGQRATGLLLAVMVMSSPVCTRRSSPAVLLRSSRDATSKQACRGSACAGRGASPCASRDLSARKLPDELRQTAYTGCSLDRAERYCAGGISTVSIMYTVSVGGVSLRHQTGVVDHEVVAGAYHRQVGTLQGSDGAVDPARPAWPAITW